MYPESPYYLFDPSSIGWLHRRHAAGEVIRKDDIIRLLEADPDNASDPLLQNYLVPALKGELNGKRGRPPRTFGRKLKLWLASHEYQERLAVYRAGRRGRSNRRNRSDLEPSVVIAGEVAREFRLGCTGRGFLNEISRMKKEDNS